MLMIERVMKTFKRRHVNSLNAFLKSPVVSITGIDVAKPPEMLLSEFLKMYTLYCYNLELEPLERKKDIVRQLRTFKPGKLIVRQRYAHWVYGLKLLARGPCEDTQETDASNRVEGPLLAFLKERCTVTGDSHDTLPFKYQTIPSGGDETSLIGIFSEWCAEKKLASVPEVTRDELAVALAKVAPTSMDSAWISQQREDTYSVLGISDMGMHHHAVTCSDNPFFCRETFTVEMFTVLLQLTFLVAPSAYLIHYAITYNTHFAGLVGHPRPYPTLTIGDIYRNDPLPHGNYFILRQFELIIYPTFVFQLLSIAYLLFIHTYRFLVPLCSTREALKVAPAVTKTSQSSPSSPPPSPPDGDGLLAWSSNMSRKRISHSLSAALQSVQHHSYMSMYHIRAPVPWFKQLGFKEMVDLTFSIIFFLHVFFLFTLLGFIVTWLTFACLIDPPSLLPFMTSIFTVLFVTVAVYKASMDAQERFLRNFRRVLQQLISKRLRNAVLLAKQKKHRDAAAAGHAHFDDDVNVEDIEDCVTAKTVYQLLESMVGASDGEVHRLEVEQFLEICQIPLSKERRDMVWMACDENADGYVTLEEFEHGWEFMVTQFSLTELESIGLSTGTIFLSVAALFIVLSLVLLSLMVLLAAWSDASTFSSVVQSLSVAGAGIGTTVVKKSSVNGKSDVEEAFLHSSIQADMGR